MTDYIIYKATHPDGSYYIGYTSKSLAKRIREHRLNCCDCGSHTSTDRLSTYAVATGVLPDKWKWEEIGVANTIKEARYWKYKAISGVLLDPMCLNIRGKNIKRHSKLDDYFNRSWLSIVNEKEWYLKIGTKGVVLMIDGDFDTVKHTLMDKLKSANNPGDLQSIVLHWIDLLDDDDWEYEKSFKEALPATIDKRFKDVTTFEEMFNVLMDMEHEYILAYLIAVEVTK